MFFNLALVLVPFAGCNACMHIILCQGYIGLSTCTSFVCMYMYEISYKYVDVYLTSMVTCIV